VSYDNGKTFELLGKTRLKWHETVSSTIKMPTRNTIIRAHVDDYQHSGGFIATIKYDGKEYNTAVDSKWKFTWAKSWGTTKSTALYTTTRNWKPKGYISKDAQWIWNGKNSDDIEFEFSFADIIAHDEDCGAFPIDNFLTGCSNEFESTSNELSAATTNVASLRKGLDAANAKITANAGNLKKETGDLQKQLDDANERIAEIEKKLKQIGEVTSSAQMVGAMQDGDDDFIGYDYPQTIATSTSELADANKNLLVYCLVIFNIGTILGCLSCLYWRQKAAPAKGYVSAIQQFEDEEVKEALA